MKQVSRLQSENGFVFDIDDVDDKKMDGNENAEAAETTDEAFFENLLMKAENAAKALDVHPDVVLACLHLVNWDDSKLILEMGEKRAEFLEKVGISEEQSHNKQGLHQNPEKKRVECQVCGNQTLGRLMLALPCNHYFCKKCWKQYINVSLDNGNNFIKCMEPNCNCPLLITDISSICGTKLACKFQSRLAALSAQAATTFRRCPNPKCGFLVSSENIGLCNVVKCKCGTSICFLCGNESHAPLSCKYVDEWKGKLKEGADNNVILESTKPCPKCKARIEKNGGCIHMTCQNCKYEFCWNCGHEWNTHKGDPYDCVSYTYDFGTNTGRRSLDQKNTIDPFVDNYFAMQQEFFMKEPTVNKLVEHYKGKDIPDLREKVNKLVETEIEGRRILSWTYPALTYITDKGKYNIMDMWKKNLISSISKFYSSLQTDRLPSLDLLTVYANDIELAYNSILKQVDSIA